MLNDQEKLMKDFEQEIWLYIDNSLSESRKKYWQERLRTIPQLEEYYEETLNTLDNYNSFRIPQLNESLFISAVNKAVNSPKNHFQFFRSLLKRENKPQLLRAAFASIMIIFITTFLVIINEPVNAPKIDEAILEWDGGSLNRKITNVENSIFLLQNEKSVDKIIYNYTRDGWNLARSTIENQIKQITKEIKDNSL